MENQDLLRLQFYFKNNDFKTVNDHARALISNGNDSELIKLWYLLSSKCLEINSIKNKIHIENSFVFVTDGGWEPWNGNTLKTRGLGGSETWLIRYAEEMSKKYKVFVFCNCKSREEINDVIYLDISMYSYFLTIFEFDHVIISRFLEYYPMTYIANVKNIYIVFHDLMANYYILPNHVNLKKIFGISNWHIEYLKTQLPPQFHHKIKKIDYGIDSHLYKSAREIHERSRANNEEHLIVREHSHIIQQSNDKSSLTAAAVKHSSTQISGERARQMRFIFPSFPNRGLYQLLKFFPKIREKYPRATLNIFCRFDLDYVKSTCPYEEILQMIDEQKEYVTNHGWVNNSTLREFWKKSDIWLYPCTFVETCCLTKYEAFASETFPIYPNIGALSENGALVLNEFNENEIFNALEKYFTGELNYVIEQNKKTSDNYSWKNAADNFLKLI